MLLLYPIYNRICYSQIVMSIKEKDVFLMCEWVSAFTKILKWANPNTNMWFCVLNYLNKSINWAYIFSSTDVGADPLIR